MNKAFIRLLPLAVRQTSAIFLERGQQLAAIAKVFAEQPHERSAHIAIDDAIPVEEIAQELFDLTNHPSRQDEREEKYGTGPSLSVGDAVTVIGHGTWVCLSVGWAKVP